MREKPFPLSWSQREDMWRRFKQTDDRRVAERLHAILLLDSGQHAQNVSTLLPVHPQPLKRWIRLFVTGGEEALTTLSSVGGDGNLTAAQRDECTSWLDAEVRSTAEAIRGVEQQFGRTYSDSEMVKLRKHLDYHSKQPALLPPKPIPKHKRRG